MSEQKSLLRQVSEFSNLYRAFVRCSRGKRNSRDYLKIFFPIGEHLTRIQNELTNNCYSWGGYREFWVHDPKKRLIMCAPFLDRVVHHAICQIIEPIIDPVIPPCVYACRKNKGTRTAVLNLHSALKKYGESRFVMKLDVEQYFASIDHNVLLKRLMLHLPDTSLENLLRNLLDSHPDFYRRGKGLPIGNLSSQLFANFYLVTADQIGISQLGGGYFRYMDDIVLLGRDKSRVLDAACLICEHAENELLLKIPFQKRMPIGKDPVPFLGFVVGHTGCRVLSRTDRRFRKKLVRQSLAGACASQLAQMQASFESWARVVYEDAQV